MEDSNWQIIIEDLAKTDLQEIYEWYQFKEIGLGNSFINDFEDTLERIKLNPLHARNLTERTRSASFKKFPYQIIYITDSQNKKVFIIVITHHRRNPFWFKDKK
jgi:plasmid stabilization system protein ParE